MNERGFTIVELLIAITISLVVFGLVATSLVAYQNDSQRSFQQNDSQDQARTAVDRIVRELRNVASSRTAAPTLIEVASSYDLVFEAVTSTAPAGGSANPAGAARVRYCLPPDPAPGNASKQVLISQVETWTTAAAPTNPWPQVAGVSPACPSVGTVVPAGATITTERLAEHVTNRYAGASRPAFTYDGSSLNQIATVGIDLFVDGRPAAPPGEVRLRSAAYLRNQNQPPLVSLTATPTGGGHVLLNGGGSSDPDNQQLSFKWFKIVGTTRTQIGATGLLDWAPGAGTYTVELQVTDSGGLIGIEQRSVAVT